MIYYNKFGLCFFYTCRLNGLCLLFRVGLLSTLSYFLGKKYACAQTCVVRLKTGQFLSSKQ
jgi:hypothetical protein